MFMNNHICIDNLKAFEFSSNLLDYSPIHRASSTDEFYSKDILPTMDPAHETDPEYCAVFNDFIVEINKLL